MRRGNKPAPAALRVLRGTPGKLSTDAPLPPPLSASPPCELDGDNYAMAEWRRLVPGLIECGQVTMADRTLLVAYCLKYAQWLRLEEDARDEGAVVEGGSHNPVINPTCRLANQTLAVLLRAAGELGITPTTRTRVHRTGPPAAVSKWAGVLP
jgi:P27 family predicted phage terminase small subunit